MRGWLAYSARSTSAAQQIDSYQKLREHIPRFCEIPIVDYDASASAHFERLRQARIRIGTMDLKVAAICIAWGATLLTRNLTDFSKVTDLLTEDWSV